MTTLPVGSGHARRQGRPRISSRFNQVDYFLPHREAAWVLMEERLRDAAAFARRCGQLCTPALMEPLAKVARSLEGYADQLLDAGRRPRSDRRRRALRHRCRFAGAAQDVSEPGITSRQPRLPAWRRGTVSRLRFRPGCASATRPSVVPSARPRPAAPPGVEDPPQCRRRAATRRWRLASRPTGDHASRHRRRSNSQLTGVERVVPIPADAGHLARRVDPVPRADRSACLRGHWHSRR